MTAQEARIVVGDLAALRLRNRLNATLANQLVQQLGVVDDLIGAAHLRILITQRIEAVRTGHDDLALLRRNAFECIVQRFDVLLRQHLEEELVTRTASRVTVTRLCLRENSELHTSGVQQFGNSASGLLGIVVIDAGTADPEEVFGVVEVVNVFAKDGHLDAIFLGLLDPLRANVVVLAPRVALGLHILEQAGELGGEVRFDKHLETSHIDDVVDVFNIDGALLNAGATVSTAPQDIGVDDAHFAFANELQQRQIMQIAFGFALLDGDGCIARQFSFGAGLITVEDIRRGIISMVTKAVNQQLRAQWLGSIPRRALFLATSTLCTGGEVQHRLPGEVLDLANTNGVLFRISFFEGDDFTAGGHGLGSAESIAAVSVALEENVKECKEAVPCDTPGQAASHDEQPDHTGHQFHQGENGHHDRAGRKNLGQLHRPEVGEQVTTVVLLEGGDLASLHHHHADTFKQDDAFNEDGGLLV